MNREHIQTQETKLPELHKKTVKLEKYGEGVWVDTTIGPVDIQLGNVSLRLYGRDTEKGTIDGQEVPDNWLGVVTQPDNQHLTEGMGYAPIVRSDDGSFFGLDLGRDKPGCEAFDFDLSVSENHAAIVPDPDVDGQFMIVDTGSKNGTAVTGMDFKEDATTREQDINLSAVMALDLDSLVSGEEVASITPETIRGHNPEETEFLQSAVEAFKPVAGVELDNGKIYVSEPVKVAAPHEGTEYSLALYRDDDDRFSPLWFCKDSTEYGVAGNGEWRLSEPIIPITEHVPFKGRGKSNPHDSTAASRVVEEVEHTLAYAETMTTHETTPPVVDYSELIELRRLSGDFEAAPLIDDLAEVTEVEGRGVNAVETKKGFKAGEIEKIRDEISNMQLPKDFEPDFSEPPVKNYGLNHEVFGLSQVEVFESSLNGRPATWHVATNGDHVWLHRLEFDDSEPTVAGTQQDVIEGGALTVKPIEHVSFGGYWGEVGVDWSGLPEYPGYGDMKPTIDSMPWVRHYRQAKQAQERPTSAERTAIS